jgi:2-polyprenyl-3-methyl-5-hydroxy-6-metoxy-1,4-benzoquinol methylase
LGGNPSFKNKKILELGCGFGGLSLDMAQSGAQKVVGLEIDPKDIKVAKFNLENNYPALTKNLQFKHVNIADYPEFDFDFVVSKDVFEHVDDLANVLHDTCTQDLALCGIAPTDSMETMEAGILRINILGDT